MVLTPVAVEVLLLDWVARKLRDDGHYLLNLPGVLGDFVAYGHRRSGVPPAETTATLIAVSRSTTACWEMLDAWRSHRSADRFGTFGVPYRRRRQEEHPLQTLATEVGGLRRLEELDTEALPDEPFELDGVLAEDIRPRVDRVRSWPRAAARSSWTLTVASSTGRRSAGFCSTWRLAIPASFAAQSGRHRPRPPCVCWLARPTLRWSLTTRA